MATEEPEVGLPVPHSTLQDLEVIEPAAKDEKKNLHKECEEIQAAKKHRTSEVSGKFWCAPSETDDADFSDSSSDSKASNSWMNLNILRS